MSFINNDFDSHWRLDKINPYDLILDLINIIHRLDPREKLIRVTKDKDYKEVIIYLQSKINKLFGKSDIYHYKDNVKQRYNYYGFNQILDFYAFYLNKYDDRYHIDIIIERQYSIYNIVNINLSKYAFKTGFFILFTETLLYLQNKMNVESFDDNYHEDKSYKYIMNKLNKFVNTYVIEKKIIEALKELVKFQNKYKFNLYDYATDFISKEFIPYTGFTISYSEEPKKHKSQKTLVKQFIYKRKDKLTYSYTCSNYNNNNITFYRVIKGDIKEFHDYYFAFTAFYHYFNSKRFENYVRKCNKTISSKKKGNNC